ncbi:hypothetical protein TNCV_525631 [Trichonephila clavipes]|nr:hypothetical protein TNCV_525631 [Trichonephila clavipes]
MLFGVTSPVQQPSSGPIAVCISKHDQHIDQFFVSIRVHLITLGNGSQMTTSSRVCFTKTFCSVSPVTGLFGRIFCNVVNSMQCVCRFAR